MAFTKYVYSLPFAKRDLIEAICDPRVHFAHFRHAIDFILPEGTVIRAPRSGKVIAVKVDSDDGGPETKYNDIKYLNFISIQHSGGEISEYAHLKYKGAFVKVGDRVRKGQPVALSGNTGFSGAPHLHFQVAKLNNTTVGWESLNVIFDEKIHIDRTQRPIPKYLENELKKYRKSLKKLK